jgi:LCP family protein required for cell wall assembly
MWNTRSLIAFCLSLALLFGAVAVPAERIMPAREDIEEQAQLREDVILDPEEEIDLEAEEETDLEELLPGYVPSEDIMAAIDGVTNILLIGLDARPGQKTGRSDTMILLSLDADHGCIKLVSFMRDLYVEIPGKKNNRLNAAYAFGGPDLLIKTLKKNFGVKVDHYIAVNFSILADVIDQLGGLEIDVPEKYLPRINAVIYQDNLVLELPDEDGYIRKPGLQTLTGKQAQAYARYRYGTKDGDFGRTVRQREVVMKCMEKIKEMSMTQLAEMAIINLDEVVTDMTLMDLVNLAPAAFELKNSEVRELRIPIDGGFSFKKISKMSVMVPKLKKNKKALAQFLSAE